MTVTYEEDITIKVHSIRDKILSHRFAPQSLNLSLLCVHQDEIMLYAGVQVELIAN